MSVQGHKFQNIVMNLLKPDPSFNDVPYLGNGVIDRDVESLINNWSPNVRYYHSGQSNPLLNLDLNLSSRADISLGLLSEAIIICLLF